MCVFQRWVLTPPWDRQGQRHPAPSSCSFRVEHVRRHPFQLALPSIGDLVRQVICVQLEAMINDSHTCYCLPGVIPVRRWCLLRCHQLEAGRDRSGYKRVEKSGLISVLHPQAPLLQSIDSITSQPPLKALRPSNPTIRMKFFASALLLAATAMALPQPGDGGAGGSNVKFPVGHKTTLSEAQAKCGNDAKVSCCNKATYTRDITNVNQGPLAGVLQSALGGGPGGDGLGLFGQCNDISANGNRPEYTEEWHQLTR